VMLSAVTLHVTDLDKSVAFYRACGLVLVERRHGGPTHFSCALNGVHLALYAATATAGPQTSTSIGLTVPDLQKALDSVRATGAKLLEEARPRPWGLSAAVEDPDGRKIELLATQTEMTGPVPR
jgi:catechol 2,3-dioxygenase-like lactoylglutathione lyase family enzyme